MQTEHHRTNRVGWLRAAVLGANDGLLSTASLVLGVATAHGTHGSIQVAGLAGLVAGSMSMAAGEYVSVHSQADTERADLKREKAELLADPDGELQELADIYIDHGLNAQLALEVATQLMAKDALGAHARDELGVYRRFERKSSSSSSNLCCKFRDRCRCSFARGMALATKRTSVLSRRHCFGLPGHSWWYRSEGGRGASPCRSWKSDVLGCARHGRHGWCRSSVWHSGVMIAVHAEHADRESSA